MTPWAQLVDTNNPLPEYPRPQMVRSNWMNLNGLWQFQAGNINDPVPTNTVLARQILVPYPMESALSGIMEYHARAWYRRTFTVPAAWSGQRILLHLDAVDWESEVFVNGRSVGLHQGGYDPATYDITSYLNATDPQELIVRVYDPTDNAGEPRGKQTLSPGGIMYTSSSGIWQTVWLEPVPAISISDLKLVPDIDAGRLNLTVNVSGPTNGISVLAVARSDTGIVGVVSGLPGGQLLLPVPNPILWCPTNPFLYHLEVQLARGSTQVDTVASYFGMRKISLGSVGGFVKMLLNNQFVFQFGPLDQGFWPDGLYRAPTDEALKSDIEAEKTLGYNMVRKHIKVEPARWYYWADKLGILVWQDMPSPNSYTSNPQPLDTPQFATELTRLVQTHWNYPSIIMWVIFNESQGQHDTEALVQLVKGLDATRLVNQASGGSFYGVGDVLDWHSYPSPSCPSSTQQAVVCGEFGGVGLGITNHTWAPGWGYVAATNGADLAAKFEDFCLQLSGFVQNQGLSAAVYTEITDVEIELNGFLTYDRQVRKPEAGRIRAAIASASAATALTTVVPTSQSAGQTWGYVTNTPPSNWATTTYDDTAWSRRPGGFGANNPPNTTGLIRTVWSSSDIWLRRAFSPGNLSSQQISNLCFVVYHDEDVELYVNGVLAGSAAGYTTSYGLMPLSPAGQAALVPNATNVLAVHCHQTGGGQYIDAGLSIRESNSSLPSLPVPPAPEGLRAATGPLGVSLAWNTSAFADDYRVKRSLVSGGPYSTLVASAPVNAATDSTVSGGATCYYVVSAVNTAGESADSSEISVTTPAPPVPALVTWFKADGLTGLANGTAVAVWPDASGQGYPATQANSARRPTYVTGAIHGLPAVRFNASSSSYLSLARPVQDDFTILCVYQSSQGIGTGTQFYQGAGLISGEVPNYVNDFAVSLNVNGRLLAGTGNPDTTIVSSRAGFNDGQPHVVAFVRTQSTGALSLFVDGTAQGSAVGGRQSLNAPDQLVLGAQKTLNNYFTGDIAEIKIYSGALSDADRLAEEAALGCKYGLGAGAPPLPPLGLAASADNRQVQLSWRPVLGASGYNVRWSLNASGSFELRASNLPATNLVDVAAAIGQTNYYAVASVSACGTGVCSAPVRVFLPPPALHVAISPSALTLSWPDWADAWMLYGATNLAAPIVWSPVTNPVVKDNGRIQMMLPPSCPAQFFRLASP